MGILSNTGLTSGSATNVGLQPEATALQIESFLQQFNVFSSKAEKYIVKYAYVYFFSWALLDLVFLVIRDLMGGYSNEIGRDILVSRDMLLVAIGTSLISWAFNVWQRSLQKTLRDIFEKRRIHTPTGDVNTPYLQLLKDYHDALSSPRRYLIVSILLIVMVIYIVTNYFVGFSVVHQDMPQRIFSIMNLIFSILENLGVAYYLGIIVWVLVSSGQYIKRLSQTFELRIEPEHPDSCGGLRDLGNFCFGLASPIFVGSTFFLTYIFTYHSSSSHDYLETVSVIVLFLLLCSLSSATFAFFQPLWDIHANMLIQRRKREEIYAVEMTTLREQMQLFLERNQLEEAKIVKEKKELIAALYNPYPVWPFKIQTKILSAVIGASGSFLLALLGGLGQPLLQAILQQTS